MQQLNIHDYYDLGKNAESIDALLKIHSPKGVSARTVAWPLFLYRWRLEGILKEPCALLTSTQRAIRAIITAITNLIGYDPETVLDPEKGKEELAGHQLRGISSAIDSFETILKNDMPEMSTFAVAQIGIYRTDDLIRTAERQIAEPLRPLLNETAKFDIMEAGKCLAFRVSTASAFHICRAIETGIDQYYEALTGKAYEVSPSGGNNNWGAKTEALTREHADGKVTEFLTHIRKQYRNPVTHPEVIVDEHEALQLFGVAISAISMMLSEVKRTRDKNQAFLAFANSLGGLHGTDEPAAELGPGDEEDSLSLEAGTPAEDGSGEG